MSKIFSYYERKEDGTDVEHAWYDSSNVKYTECIDHANKPKTLVVVFSNGTKYQYYDVNVNDYLLFREDSSQGKALNRLIKENKYRYEKMGNADMASLEEELFFRRGNGFYLENNDEFFEIKNSNGESVYKLSKPLEEGYFDMVNDILKAVGLTTKVV